MNFSALTRSLLVGSALIAVTFAANAQVRQPTVFMLQFGSFETRDEANEKIKDIGTKHGALLSKYPPLIREITMPPDNLTVYRTQAGPMDTREKAQSVCSQLASQGDECYVVETAMAIPGAAPAVQQAGIIPTDEKPMPTRDPENLKVLEKVAKPLPEASKAEMIQAMDEAAVAPSMSAPAPRISSDAQLAGATRSPVVEAEEKEESFWSWLGDDEEDEAEEDAWAKRKLEAEKRATEEAAARRAAPVDTVATQEMTPPPAPTASLSPLPEEAGIMSPAPLQTLGGAPAPMAAQEAPQVDIVAPNLDQQHAMMPPPAPFASAPQQQAPASSFTPPAPVLSQNPPPVQQQTALQPLQPADAQLGSQGLRLPPPPPPTNPATRDALSRGELPTAATMQPAPLPTEQPFASGPAPVLASPAPESTGSITATNLPPAPFKKGASVTGAKGEEAKVEVGEAQRVPLTESQQQAPVEQMPAKVIGVNEEPEVAENTPPPVPATPVAPPSSQAIQKTLWAHIHYFPDQQAALSFWDHYRNAHPDFPVVRVRTTSSLVAQQQGDMRVSLRIGPFAQRGFIQSLCGSVQQVHETLKCGAITDMGASANAYAPRDRFVQAAAASARYANKIAPNAAGFWVQIGTYPSVDEAQLAWDDARTRHSDALSDMKPAIVSPEQGSQAAPVFRLRTGPFSTQMAAKDVCSRMKVNSGTCLVVSE